VASLLIYVSRASGRVEELETQLARVKLQLELALITGSALSELVAKDLLHCLNSTDSMMEPPNRPTRFERLTAEPAVTVSGSGPSHGSAAHDLDFPTVGVVEEEWGELDPDIESGENTDKVFKLLCQAQHWLVKLADARGDQAPMREIDVFQPIVRALWAAVISLEASSLSLSEGLQLVALAGEGVKFNSVFKKSGNVPSIPDVVAYARVPHGTKFENKPTESQKKLLRLVVANEVKTCHAGVIRAAAHQSRWYLAGMCGVLQQRVAKQLAKERFVLTTDIFSWAFSRGDAVPPSGTASWHIALVGVTSDRKEIVKYLRDIARRSLQNLVVGGTPPTPSAEGESVASDGSEEDNSTADGESSSDPSVDAEAPASDSASPSAELAPQTLCPGRRRVAGWMPRGDGFPRGDFFCAPTNLKTTAVAEWLATQ
jgi:hypothetical protein